MITGIIKALPFVITCFFTIYFFDNINKSKRITDKLISKFKLKKEILSALLAITGFISMFIFTLIYFVLLKLTNFTIFLGLSGIILGIFLAPSSSILMRGLKRNTN